ncbi:preprotein translocase subunit SecG [Helcococcus kunzii]|uniref:Protein-export membrane protein SecG n=1 Tax=Helcococcus kunzii ATCC 51366 TaxID=883114 RepID=H3NMW0_9FIRM|nr:preprotein translocase subunit SecG [Helcococcus kunzii]EHR34701.1 preprotein translocase, SecG subunit [Helcococcus kunzii ATCC 51366]MCT1795355.1 preprotein translocase subunit SecG [Helcococcus kunzii]MCT1989536.1 preprotein translocase subunit SecG [Helcococcus kunzii]QUY64610.1 preprotein translocase subunit SecG [Helcococcus kunzii]QZO77026.1 preprotein translocase subunit SecG [Helcococcus kunzii]
MNTLFTALILISCVGIIISTLFMEPKSEGTGALSGSSSNVFGKTASRGKEALLNKLTIIFGVIFVISTIALTILSK